MKLLLITLFFLGNGLISGSNDFETNLASGTSTVPTPTPQKSIWSKADTTRNLLSFRRLRTAKLFRTYGLQRKDRYKLLNGSYNNRYETRYFNDFVMEVQALGGKVLGVDVIFYERKHLGSRELTFLWRLIKGLPNNQKLDDSVKESFIKAAETDGMSRDDVSPVVFGKLSIFARRAGPGATVIVIEPSETLIAVDQ